MLAFSLACLPLLIISILLAVFHYGAVKASIIAYGACLLIGAVFFGANRWVIYYAHIKGFLYALDVLLIIWAAFLFYLIVEKTGSIQMIGQTIPSLTYSREMQALVVGWIFTSFLQGVGGFGVPVAVVAPILVSLDFSPLQAVLIPSIGHGWAVTFGSLGSSFRALLTTTAQSPQPLGITSAFLLGVSAIGSGLSVLYLSGGRQAVRNNFWYAFGLGGLMGLILIGTVWAGFWNLGSFLAATGGLGGFMLLIRLQNKNHHFEIKKVKKLAAAFSGYLILITVILGGQFLNFLRGNRATLSLSSYLPEYHTSLGLLNLPIRTTASEKVGDINLLIHPGIILLYACIITFVFYRILGKLPSNSIAPILQEATNRLLPTTLCVLAMVILAVLMETCGMTEIIANSLAKWTNRNYAIIVPLVGGIGAFITGSNTNSNILFGLLQTQTAAILKLPIFLILAGQTSGASIASVLAPAKIIVGTSTSGLLGEEGLVFRKLLPFVIIEVLLISMILYFATQY